MATRQTGGRNELAAGLRAARVAAGLTTTYAGADRAGTNQSKISRVENGRTVPSPEFVLEITTAYGTPQRERDRLVALARDVEASNRRIVMHRDPSATQSRISRIQEQAVLVRGFAAIGLAGLLQTEDYALNLFAARRGHTPEAESGARRRLAGQAILDEPESRRRFVYLMTEGALGWAFGGPHVMSAQMDHLIAATHRRNVRIGIVPFGAWDPTLPLPLNGWEMYDDRLVIVGTVTATATLDQPGDIAAYRAMFDKLERLAVYDDDARTILARVADQYRTLLARAADRHRTS